MDKLPQLSVFVMEDLFNVKIVGALAQNYGCFVRLIRMFLWYEVQVGGTLKGYENVLLTLL